MLDLRTAGLKIAIIGDRWQKAPPWPEIMTTWQAPLASMETNTRPIFNAPNCAFGCFQSKTATSTRLAPQKSQQ